MSINLLLNFPASLTSSGLKAESLVVISGGKTFITGIHFDPDKSVGLLSVSFLNLSITREVFVLRF